MPRKFFKKYIFIYIIGGLVGEGQKKTRSDNADKEKMGCLRHSCLRSDGHSPGGKSQVPRNCNIDFFETPALALD